MSQENVETISRLYEEFLARPERLASPEQLAFFDPAVEIHQSESLLGTKGTFHGYDGLGQAAREMFDVFSEAHYLPKRLVDVGDQVVATVEFRAIGKEGGVRIAETVAHVWTLEGGRIVPGASTWTRPRHSRPWGRRSTAPKKPFDAGLARAQVGGGVARKWGS